MQTRKVQKTGKSTFIVSLPKPWVKKIGINVGDSIGVIPLSDGTMLLNPILEKNKQSRDREYTIKMEDESVDKLTRRLIGAYLGGFDIIEIKPKGKFTNSMMKEIRHMRENIIGLEIINEDNRSIRMKDFLDSSDFSLMKGVKRMYSISYTMYRDAMKSFETGDEDLLQDVINKDEEVDKLHWMICKQYNKLLDDVYFAEKMGLTPKEALGFLLASNSIERIADHTTKIAHNTKNLIGKEQIPIADEIISLGDKVIELLNDAINGLYRSKFELADNVLENSKVVEEEIYQMKHTIASYVDDPQILVAVAYIVDSLFRILSYSKDIAETTIDHLILISED